MFDRAFGYLGIGHVYFTVPGNEFSVGRDVAVLYRLGKGFRIVDSHGWLESFSHKDDLMRYEKMLLKYLRAKLCCMLVLKISARILSEAEQGIKVEADILLTFNGI